jgi:hypothetical protein
MLTKTQLAERIAGKGGGGKQQVLHVLNELANVAAEEIEAGEDFVVPGVCRIKFTYRAPQKKGAKYKKGDTYTGFGGVEQIAEEDSKPVSEQIKLRATPTGKVGQLKPGTKPEAQKEFLKSRAGKAVKKRLA